MLISQSREVPDYRKRWRFLSVGRSIEGKGKLRLIVVVVDPGVLLLRKCGLELGLDWGAEAVNQEGSACVVHLVDRAIRWAGEIVYRVFDRWWVGG